MHPRPADDRARDGAELALPRISASSWRSTSIIAGA